jgi:leucyl aminopeptidase
MEVKVVSPKDVAFEPAGSCLVIPAFTKDFPLRSTVLTADDENVLQAVIDREAFTAKAGTFYFLPTPTSGYGSVLLLGLGAVDKYDAEVLRRTAGAACGALKQNRIHEVTFDISHFESVSPDGLLEGILLGQYGFEVYKHQPEDAPAPVRVEQIRIVVGNDADMNAVQKSAELSALCCLSTNGARHLANTPPNECTPEALAEFARGIQAESGCKCTILEEKQMASLGMGALLGVAQGSAQPPRLIVLEHHHSDDVPTIAIVGKGVTFDTGGISIKPSAAMHEMKFDMCGAAAVLCAMMTIAELKPAINVLCVVPAVENMPSHNAQRPGDIVKAYNGKTVEVHNTDAEGRLILADAMAYVADKYKPDMMVDLATLTGACVIALAHNAAGLFSNNDDLCAALTTAGDTTGERVWRMPLWEDHERLVDGNHADLCNIGPREGGAISAAAFLKRFIGDTPAWAHLDIAGTAWGGKHLPYLDANHATGFGVRLLTNWIIAEAERAQ